MMKMNQQKNNPQRTCMGCNHKTDKQKLIRIVKNKDNQIMIDKEYKNDGRGAYICNNSKCLEKLIKTNRLSKLFKMPIPQEVYDNLRGVISDK